MGDVVNIRDEVAEVPVDVVLDAVRAAGYKSVVLVGINERDVPVLHATTGDFGQILLHLAAGRRRVEDALTNG